MTMENSTVLASSSWWQVALPLLKVTKTCIDSLWLPALDVATFKYFSLSFQILKTNETLYKKYYKIPYNHTMHLKEERMVDESD